MIRRAFLLSTVAALGACATPMVQMPGLPEVGFTGPRLEKDAFISFDGARLGYSEWLPDGEPWAVIVALHGMNEYAGRFTLAGSWWAKQGIATLAYDQRGYGRSPGRGVWAGQDLIDRDLRTMIDLARARYPRALLVVTGVSMGGGAAMAAFGSDNPPKADRLVLLSPAVWGWSTQPIPYRTALWIVGKTAPGLQINPPTMIANHIHPTDNLAEMFKMRDDPMMTWGTRTDTLYGVVDLMQKASDSAARIKVPTLYLYGYRDVVIPKAAAMLAAGGLPDGDKTGYYLDGYHLLLIDKQRERIFADVVGFIRDPGAPLVSGVGPIPKPPQPRKPRRAPGRA